MKYLKQMTIIMAVSLIAEICHSLIPLPVPTSIYGMVLMFLLLEFKLVKLSQVEDVAQFFMAIMPILFVDPNVKLMTVVGGMKSKLAAILIVSAVSTAVVMALTGLVAQAIIRGQKKREGDRHE